MTGDTDEYGRPTGLHELPSPERYLLSPKDLCTYENLLQLVNSPVVSLKIEGRMKSPEYVCDCCLNIPEGSRCNCTREKRTNLPKHYRISASPSTAVLRQAIFLEKTLPLSWEGMLRITGAFASAG